MAAENRPAALAARQGPDGGWRRRARGRAVATGDVLGMASVEVRKVFKRFGSVEVLHGIDVTIEDGAFVVLLGPSGCGKSTLLRMIAGLEEVTAGEIAIGGRTVNNVPPKDRDIAMVFQNYALYPHMKVYDNMAFGLKLRGADKDAIDRKVRQAAAILNLTEYLDRYPRQLSGGQRQRVAMGRAIVRDPQVFLFDEPLSNLDAKLRVQMRTEIRELHQRLKSTSIYVTHDQIEAMTMADKIVVMRDGHIEQSGAPLDVYDRPDNLFVAGFIGSPAMNLVQGAIRRSGERAQVVTADGAALPLASAAAAPDGTKVVYGIRPDHLALANGSGALEIEVAVVEPTGAETLVVGKLGGAVIQAAFRERHSFKPGQRVPMMPMLDKVHLFDAGSGRRLG
jgi:multiple sugar transport system ATP-binding protein